MTNLEWMRTLPAEKLVGFLKESCRTCIHYGNCRTEDSYDCSEGKVAWLNREYKKELKSCPVCKGEMDIKYRDGYYLVCPGCGLHFGIDAEAVEEGIIEGGYSAEEALADAWNVILDGGVI